MSLRARTQRCWVRPAVPTHGELPPPPQKTGGDPSCARKASGLLRVAQARRAKDGNCGVDGEERWKHGEARTG